MDWLFGTRPSRSPSRSSFDPLPYSEASAEQQRLSQADLADVDPAKPGSPKPSSPFKKSEDSDWKRWGPYLSERQWGTVREDYSTDGNAWEYLPFDLAHKVAYRWGEDGIAGFSDRKQLLCISMAMWNGHDHILKERLFGLANPQGNHGEDVKELYYYLDATPSHSYLKMLYKYPQSAFPYKKLQEVNSSRSAMEPEFELLDTGIFDEDRYFDVFVEYARAGVDDILCRMTVHNRGAQPATFHALPQLWFRKIWTNNDTNSRPSMVRLGEGCVELRHAGLGVYHLYVEDGTEVLFCENDTNIDSATKWVQEKGLRTASGSCWDGLRHVLPCGRTAPRAGEHGASKVFPQHTCDSDGKGPFKDAFHAFIVNGDHSAVASDRGTKVGLYTQHTISGGESISVRFRLRQVGSSSAGSVDAFLDFDKVFSSRVADADAFYDALQHKILGSDRKVIQRQALAGMIWTKMFYYYDVRTWVDGDPNCAKPPDERRSGRNCNWQHLCNSDVISMPDKWEFPWYATWDLAFHCLPLALVDSTFAKQQLILFTTDRYMHPNGQLPAYEWNFSDVNPPVHAWATLRVFQMEKKQRGGSGDLNFLEQVFHKLELNFMWWVNCKDIEGSNTFQGGFLGLDNIGVFERSGTPPSGGYLNQADGSGWMAFYSLCLTRIAMELALHNPTYESVACKFFEHFLLIAKAMNGSDNGTGLWDHQDSFYYDVLCTEQGSRIPLKVRSLVGIIPLIAVETFEPEVLSKLPVFAERVQSVFNDRQGLTEVTSSQKCGQVDRRMVSVMQGDRLRCVLQRMLDSKEFLSEYGVRGLSRYHEAHPYVFEAAGRKFKLSYEPGEALVALMGGNSNWRGPIWFPINYLIVESLQKFHQYYGESFHVEFPTGSGNKLNLLQVAGELSDRLIKIFELGKDGVRPSMRYHDKMADPHFKDHVLFHEYFHGDTGRGCGASHQTGWTGLVAKLVQLRAEQGNGT